MQMFGLDLTEDEAGLIEALREVTFGEVYGVRLTNSGTLKPRRINAAERAMILEMRNGMNEVSVLHVHDGQPAFAEVEETINGFRCRKKVRFAIE